MEIVRFNVFSILNIIKGKNLRNSSILSFHIFIKKISVLPIRCKKTSAHKQNTCGFTCLNLCVFINLYFLVNLF